MGIPSRIDEVSIFVPEDDLGEIKTELLDYLPKYEGQAENELSLETIFDEFNLSPVFDSSGNLISIHGMGEKLYDINDFLETITPYVRSKSYIIISHSGEGGPYKEIQEKWYFMNGRVEVTSQNIEWDE